MRFRIIEFMRMNPKDVKIILSEIIDLKEFLYSANTY